MMVLGIASGVVATDRNDYRTWDDYVAELLEIEENYSELVNLHIIGHSHENRPIYALEISSEAGINDGRPESLHMGMHHGCEWPSGEMAMDLAWYLLENYGTVDQVTDIVENIRVWIIPVVNPDGFVYQGEHLNQWIRKNRRPPETSGIQGGSIGVDLNRNYPYFWGCDEGSSSDEASHVYRGPYPFSEPELWGIRDLYLNRHIITTITGHTTGRWIVWPWAHTKDPAPDAETLAELGNEMNYWSNYNAYQWSEDFDHETGTGGLGGTPSGEATDWIYGMFGGLAYTFEYGDMADGFRPDYEKYREEFQRNILAFLHNIEQAAHYSSVISGNVTDTQGNPLEATLHMEVLLTSPGCECDDCTYGGLCFMQRTSISVSGAYEWHVLPSKQPEDFGPQPYIITASAPGMHPQTVQLEIDSYSEQHQLNFQLQSDGSLCEVSDPVIDGPTFVRINAGYEYTVLDSDCNCGAEVEYTFGYWYDNQYQWTEWCSSGTATLEFDELGPKTISVRARCVLSNNLSGYSSRVIHVRCLNSPDMPSGPTRVILGEEYTYTTGGSSCGLGGDVMYYLVYPKSNKYYTAPFCPSDLTTTISFDEVGIKEIYAVAYCNLHEGEYSQPSETLTVEVLSPLEAETVSTAEELESALDNTDIKTIIFNSDITANINAGRLINLDFSTFMLDGDVRFNTAELGEMFLDGSAEPSITGNLRVTARNATVINNVSVGGTVTIRAVDSETWVENADGNDLEINLQEGSATVYINGNVNNLIVTSSREGLSIVITETGSVQNATFNDSTSVTGGERIVSAHISAEGCEFDEAPGEYTHSVEVIIGGETINPPLTVEWLPPVSNMEEFVLQNGTTLPLKFRLINEDGNVVEEILEDISLKIEDVETWELGEGGDSLRFDNDDYHYNSNFHTRNYDNLEDGETYTANVYHADGYVLGSISFEISISRGVGRGRGPQK